ncbi:MAG: RNA polymerase sigma-54 factor, partial [Bacteroidetes bacterium]|nr:RNA polymerase sigma-54 factor [Bacteroidota bacterium]
MALSQSLQQKLLQKLSPQQIQLMKLLQVPTANLEERIKEELEENPALEMSEDEHDDGLGEEMKDEFENTGDEYEAEGTEDEYDNIDISEYVSEFDDDVADYKLRDENYPDVEENRTMPHRVETSFHELLLEQLGMMLMDERLRKIAEQIVGSIDDDGYLRRETASIVDDLAFRQNIVTNEQEIEELIKKIQEFDPPGVAARDLQECLLLQLHRNKGEGKAVELAIEVLSKYFDEFTKKHYDKIQRGLELDDEQLKEIINQIIRLNPKPGGNIEDANKNENYVIPDFFITNHAGKLELSLNTRN